MVLIAFYSGDVHIGSSGGVCVYVRTVVAENSFSLSLARLHVFYLRVYVSVSRGLQKSAGLYYMGKGTI